MTGQVSDEEKWAASWAGKMLTWAWSTKGALFQPLKRYTGQERARLSSWQLLETSVVLNAQREQHMRVGPQRSTAGPHWLSRSLGNFHSSV